VGHKPGRLVGHTEHALKLLRAHALLAGAHQVAGLQPDVKLDLAGLEHSADRDGELLAALSALVQAGAMGGAGELVELVDHSAVRTDDAIGPAQTFKVRARGFFVLEVRLVVEVRLVED